MKALIRASATLEVRKRSEDYHVQLEGHPEVWACGKTIDEALGNWLRTHKDRLKVEVVYK
jgi:hypothetical protein